jgi:D-3-phosphoglycerate dehydrogenase
VPDPVDALVLGLLEWLGDKPRPYAEVIEAWRTSCPRLPVWEEANARGLIMQQHRDGVGSFVSVSQSGREWLARHRIPSNERRVDKVDAQSALNRARETKERA